MTMLYARHLLFYAGLIMKYQILLTHDSHETKSRFSTPASAVLALSDWTLSPVNRTGCILSSKCNGEVHAVMKNPFPAESFLYEKRMQHLVTAYAYPAAKFLSVYASKYTSASFTVSPSSIVLSSCKEKMRSIVRIFLLHQFSSALIIPQNICVIAENHLLFPAYPLKC